MTAYQRIDECQIELRNWVPTILDTLKQLDETLQQLPEDRALEATAQKHRLSCVKVIDRIMCAFESYSEANDLERLNHLHEQALCVAQTVGFTIIMAAVKIMRKNEPRIMHVQGDWAMDEALPVERAIRKRLESRHRMLLLFHGDFVALRDPANQLGHRPKTAAEVDRMEAAAKELDAELTSLLDLPGATVTYGRYLHIETILRHFDNFTATVLGNGPSEWLDGSPMIHAAGVH